MHLIRVQLFPLGISATALFNTSQEIYTSPGHMRRLIKGKELYGRGSITTLGRSSFYRRVKDGSFPRPVLIGVRSVAWESEAVEKWLASRPTRDKSAV